MTTYFVTGCTGYIGRNLMPVLSQQPEAVVYGLSRSPAKETSYGTILHGDVLGPELFEHLERIQPDVIFHLASTPRGVSFDTQFRVNVMGTRQLLQAVMQLQLDTKVVITGSSAEYGPQPQPLTEDAPLLPVSDYGFVKMTQSLLATRYIRQFQSPVILARVFNIYGRSEESLAVASLARQIAQLEQDAQQEGSALQVFNLLSSRDLVYIDDVIQALLALGEKGHVGETYNIASGQTTPIQSVLEQLLSYSDIAVPQLNKNSLQVQEQSLGVYEKLSAHTGWQPKTSLAEGLKLELDFWRQQVAKGATAEAAFGKSF